MATALANAEAALSRGDYGECLALLEVLAKENPLPCKEGYKIRMTMVTALLGKGDDNQALSICRILTKCKDEEIRQNAKYLISILEAPSLERPENWSIKLPELNLDVEGNPKAYKGYKRSKNKPEKIYPPTGTTKNLEVGFTILLAVILLILTVLLSGCIKITTEIDTKNNSQIQMSWYIDSKSRKTIPWQIDFQESLIKQIPKLDISNSEEGSQIVRTTNLSTLEAEETLKKFIKIAAETSGFKTPDSDLKLYKRNFFIGYYEDLVIDLDLEMIPVIPGLEVNLIVEPSKINNYSGLNKDDNVIILNQGQSNTLEFHSWKWSLLGVGTLFIVILLFLSLLLQRVRLKIGFGYPELPP